MGPRLRCALWSSAGAVAIYATMAAVGGRAASPTTGALLAPVPEANAEPRFSHQPDVTQQTIEFAEKCDKTFFDGKSTLHYAEHVFPSGRRTLTLAMVRVLGHYAQPNEKRPGGYAHTIVAGGVFLRDGAVAVLCGGDDDPDRFDAVTIVVPKVYKVKIDTAFPEDVKETTTR